MNTINQEIHYTQLLLCLAPRQCECVSPVFAENVVAVRNVILKCMSFFVCARINCKCLFFPLLITVTVALFKWYFAWPSVFLLLLLCRLCIYAGELMKFTDRWCDQIQCDRQRCEYIVCVFVNVWPLSKSGVKLDENKNKY